MNKKKIILFSSNTRYVGPPLGLLSITKLLDLKKYDVKIITKNEYPNFEEEVLRQCDDALCLGISTITGFPVKVAKKISVLVKKEYPDLPIIWGGWQTTTLPKETLQVPYVDYVCMGQGEKVFSRLIEVIASGNTSGLPFITGLGYKKGRKIVLNGRNPTENLENMPDFNMDLINWEKYLEVTDFGKRVIRISTSYGCPYRCGFCCEPLNSQRRWQALSARRVIRFIRKLRNRVHFDGLMIVDSNFFINEYRVIDICKGLVRNKFHIKFGQVNGRTNNLVSYKPETWKLMKKAGLYNILIGAESGNEDTLQFINKDATVDDTITLAKICNTYKIFLVASVIIGLPTDKYFNDSSAAFREDLRGIIDLYNHIGSAGSLHHLLTFPYAPLPFSPLYERAKKLGFVPPKGLDQWSDYEFTGIHVPWIPESGFRKVRVLNYISSIVGINFSYLLTSIPRSLRMIVAPSLDVFKKIGMWRFRTKYLSFPIDMWIFTQGVRTFMALNKRYKLVNIGEAA